MDLSRGNRPGAGNGDEAAGKRLEATFVDCQDELYGMLYYLLGNAEDARDVLQETFVKCWRRLRSVSDVENLRAWIFRVALNAGRDLRGGAWRRRSRTLDGEETLVARDQSPEADAGSREEMTLLRQALVHLRPQEQEVFLLRQNGRMTYEEIALSLNVPVGTVKTRVRLALRKLREVLESRDS